MARCVGGFPVALFCKKVECGADAKRPHNPPLGSCRAPKHAAAAAAAAATSAASVRQDTSELHPSLNNKEKKENFLHVPQLPQITIDEESPEAQGEFVVKA